MRWYLGFRSFGLPSSVANKVNMMVSRYNLSDIVPSVRFERGVHRRSEFYIFLAIESDTPGVIPEVAENTLLSQSFLGERVSNPFTLEELKSSVGAEHDVQSYTRYLEFRPPPPPRVIDPFDLNPTHGMAVAELAEINDQQGIMNKLLLWLSARGNGTWQDFISACQQLRLDEPRRILRRLRLLGHIETSPDGQKWSVAPTAIVDIAHGQGILCGARTSALIKHLRVVTSTEIANQPSAAAPERIAINSTDANSLIHVLHEQDHSVENAGEASCKLSAALPKLNQWKASLYSLQGILSTQYNLRWFDGRHFIPREFDEFSGFYQLFPLDESQLQPGVAQLLPRYSLYFDKETQGWLQGDWYGLRYLALQANGVSCTAHYDLASRRLAIPVNHRWPEIYERALVLASGWLPTQSLGWLIYENVDRALADVLCLKLNAGLKETLV